MSAWVAGAIVVGAVVTAVSADRSSSKAERSVKDASQRQAKSVKTAAEAQLQSQREQLDYLKEVDALPREMREKALTQLGDVYLGPNGFEYPEGQLLDQAKNSEMFAMLRDQGNEAVLRGASATGGLRSGSASEALADNQQRALMTSYGEQQKQYEMGLQGVASLANIPLQTANISNVMGNMGITEAGGIRDAGTALTQGQIAAAQIEQQGAQNVSSIVGSGISAAAQVYANRPVAPPVQPPASAQVIV